MSVITSESNALTQAAAVDQAIKAKAVVTVMAADMGMEEALPRTERLLLSRKNLLRNPCTPSTT